MVERTVLWIGLALAVVGTLDLVELTVREIKLVNRKSIICGLSGNLREEAVEVLVVVVVHKVAPENATPINKLAT